MAHQISSGDLLLTTGLTELTLDQLEGTLTQMLLKIAAWHCNNFTLVGTGNGVFGTQGHMVTIDLVHGLEITVLTLPWSFGTGVGMLLQVDQISHPATPTSFVGTSHFQLADLSFVELIHDCRKINFIAHWTLFFLTLESCSCFPRNMVATACCLLGVSQ